MAAFPRTLAAFADTIVPPDEGPGGSAVGALELYADPFYRAAPALPLVAIDLNARALFRHGRFFATLPLEQRTALVAAAERSWLMATAYEGMVMLTKLAFYGALKSDAGHRHIGFPGANDGYPDPEAAPSFDGETDDGNYP